ncbi:hypothetical protein C6T59_03095 [Burkholderia multivorans]|nr:hypothetical protein C6Q01_18040 [Burkholderia multivorans]PRF92017.1 hypothetical protein C6Q23_08335 [Burkholderia multivorans]PRG70484.1 hypothetical protein C6T59_03095 [Burkholderia multivorans]
MLFSLPKLQVSINAFRIKGLAKDGELLRAAIRYEHAIQARMNNVDSEIDATEQRAAQQVPVSVSDDAFHDFMEVLYVAVLQF